MSPAADGFRVSDLSGVPTDDLISEIYRRKEVIAWTITADEIVNYWECDDAGTVPPCARVPSSEAWDAMRKAFERFQDRGAASEAFDYLRDAWIETDGEEGGCK